MPASESPEYRRLHDELAQAQADLTRQLEQARRRHAVEDAAQSGKPARVQTGFRVIPDNETNFKGPAEAPYTSAELSAYLARRKGRAGEPHGSLLR